MKQTNQLGNRSFRYAISCLRRLRDALPLVLCMTSLGNTQAAEVGVEWDPVDDPRVGYYEVHWGTEQGDYQWSETTNSTSTTISDLAPGGTYYIAARACEEGGRVCSDFSEEILTTVDQQPLASFSISTANGVAPHSVTFSDTSSGQIDAYLWDFGDGSTSTAVSPQHTYTEPGVYSVGLTVSGAGGSSTTIQPDSVSVEHAAPIADFVESVTQGVAPLTVTFEDASTGAVDAFSWEFGDGSTATGSTSVHTYSDPGTYMVRLEVQGPGGVSSKTKAGLVEVLAEPPSADLAASPTSGPAPMSVQFEDLSTGDVDDYQWDFGDGVTSSLRNPTHTYDEPGGYDITLTVSGPGGSDSVTIEGHIQVWGDEVPLEVGEITLDHQWQRIELARSFADPVVILTSMSANGGDPAIARVESVDNNGFSVRVQEWDYLDGIHTSETLGYLVVERGIHAMPDGTWIEADRIEQDGEGYVFNQFTAPFGVAPVMLSTVVTNNDSRAVTTRMRAIDISGFELALQHEERDGTAHGVETVAYVAWQPGTVEINGVPVEVGRTSDVVSGSPYSISFGNHFSNPPVLLAGMQSADGSDTASLRWRDKDALDVRVWVEEEQSLDAEIAHTTEVVGYVAIGDAYDDVPLEVGEVDIDDQWQWVDFAQEFSQPVLIAKLTSAFDTDPAVVRIQGLDKTGFWVRLQEWRYLDGHHAVERVAYMVVETGRHELPNGSWLEAGRIATGVTESFESRDFDSPFTEVPVVLTSIGTFNGSDTVTTRVRNIDESGFELGLQEEEANDQWHLVESINYIALEPGLVEANGFRFEVGRSEDAVTHAPYTIGFESALQSPPVFLADMQSTDGGDTASLRCDFLDEYSVDVWVQEEQSANAEVWHTSETVGFIIVDMDFATE